ncbi:hypothetical protein CDN99_20285 [Roseateles aquatilis]|uniref:Uncharacterized protein n=1 Tax=Roseateles aquatilis TaxID=431061 RepID=A0A246J0Q0_9BURK|nr:hypothetical protein [Roseateles aquatilis]OWQ86180.1 hypothetical protein CDN99_20285 [Roseateles aquatilis]
MIEKRRVIVGLMMTFAATAGAQNAGEERLGSASLGVSIVKPKDWHIRSSNETLALAKMLKPSDPEAERRWRDAMRAPLVVVAKYPAAHQGLNPAFRVDVKPYGSVPSNASGAAIVEAMANMLKANFKDMQVEKGPLDLSLKGQKAGYIKLNYVNVSTTGFRFPTTAEFWAIPRKDHYVVLGGSYGTGDAAVEADMAAIVKTVSFD